MQMHSLSDGEDLDAKDIDGDGFQSTWLQMGWKSGIARVFGTRLVGDTMHAWGENVGIRDVLRIGGWE
jgi:hypothetical protein